MKIFLYAVVFGLLAGCQPALQSIVGTQTSALATISPTASAGPVMRVQIPSQNSNADLSRIAISNGVETWLTVDNISLSFRRGVLVASRGLGFDLMGADAQGTLTAIAGHGAPVYRRQMRYLNGVNQSTFLTAGCSMKVIGAETVRGQRLTRLEEECQAGRNTFTNIFWLNASGAIVETRQWVSPEIGYLSSALGKKRTQKVLVIVN